MKDFLISAFSDVNGQVSSNRIFLACIMIFLIGASTVSVVATGSIPDIADSWIYLVGIFAGVALGGKATEAMKSFSTKETNGESQ